MRWSALLCVLLTSQPSLWNSCALPLPACPSHISRRAHLSPSSWAPSHRTAQENWGARKADYKPLIMWESDGKSSLEWLSLLLRPEFGFTLLPGADGRMPKAKGAAAKREYAIAISTGPYATRERNPPDEVERVEVPPPHASHALLIAESQSSLSPSITHVPTHAHSCPLMPGNRGGRQDPLPQDHQGP